MIDSVAHLGWNIRSPNENKASESAMVKMAIHMVILVTPKEESEYSLTKTTKPPQDLYRKRSETFCEN